MRLVIAAAAIAALSLAACGKEPEKEKPGVTVNADGYRVVTKDGTLVTADVGGSVDAKTPDFAPVFPGADVKVSSTTDQGPNKVGSVTYVSSAKPQDVIAFHKKKAEAAGFTTSAEANVGVGLMFTAEDKTSGRTVQAIATTEGQGSTVVLSWTTPKS